jgi:hypothetical protein
MINETKQRQLAQWLLENSPYYFEQAMDEAYSLLNNPDFDVDNVLREDV